MRVATQQAATDPLTGRIDMDLITTGTSAADRQAVDALAEQVHALLKKVRGPRIRLNDLKEQLQAQTGKVMNVVCCFLFCFVFVFFAYVC